MISLKNKAQKSLEIKKNIFKKLKQEINCLLSMAPASMMFRPTQPDQSI